MGLANVRPAEGALWLLKGCEPGLHLMTSLGGGVNSEAGRIWDGRKKVAGSLRLMTNIGGEEKNPNLSLNWIKMMFNS